MDTTLSCRLFSYPPRRRHCAAAGYRGSGRGNVHFRITQALVGVFGNGKRADAANAKCLQCMPGAQPHRSEEHTSELQSLMRISYAVFCLKKKKTHCSRRYKT